MPQPQVASAPALQWVITSHRARAPLRDAAQEREAVLADRVVDRDVLGRDRVGLVPGGVGALGRRAAARPSRARGRAPSAGSPRSGRVASSAACALRERGVGRIAIERQREPVGADGADQRRAAHPHPADRERRGVRVGDPDAHQRVRQRALVDHLDVARALGGRTSARYGGGVGVRRRGASRFMPPILGATSAPARGC